MMTPDNSLLDECRITFLFPIPARGFVPKLKPKPEPPFFHPITSGTLERLGFTPADPATSERVQEGLAPYPDRLDLRVLRRGTEIWLFAEREGYLIPHPAEEIPFEPGDDVYDLKWEVDVYEAGEFKTRRLRLGKVLEGGRGDVVVLWEQPDAGPEHRVPKDLRLRPQWMAVWANNNRNGTYPFAPHP